MVFTARPKSHPRLSFPTSRFCASDSPLDVWTLTIEDPDVTYITAMPFRLSRQVIVPGQLYHRTSPITKLPTEILDTIFLKMRVNDQICLALTSKFLAQQIRCARKLACNSRKITDRYEAWRFQWLSTATDPAGSLSRKQYDMTHIRRSIKSSRSDLKARLGAKRGPTADSNVETVAFGRNNNAWAGRLRSR